MLKYSELDRGEFREKNLDRDIYFTDRYFELKQLFSFSHQIEIISNLKPTSILEVGVGNGFTSTYLRKAGYDIVTVDINESLNPDICAPLSELESCLNGRRFDLVVCCEVLEHMPFDQFESNLVVLKAIGDRLFMTLPNHKRYFGFGGVLTLPKIKPIEINFHFGTRLLANLPKEHFWEIGYSRETTLKSITRILRTFYKTVETKNIASNPYHRCFFGTS